jgi:hypothetical protein
MSWAFSGTCVLLSTGVLSRSTATPNAHWLKSLSPGPTNTRKRTCKPTSPASPWSAGPAQTVSRGASRISSRVPPPCPLKPSRRRRKLGARSLLKGMRTGAAGKYSPFLRADGRVCADSLLAPCKEGDCSATGTDVKLTSFLRPHERTNVPCGANSPVSCSSTGLMNGCVMHKQQTGWKVRTSPRHDEGSELSLLLRAPLAVLLRH